MKQFHNFVKNIQIIRIYCLTAGLLVFLSFYSRSAEKQAGTGDTVKIGLLISDIQMKEARRGAELAVREANQKNQLNGRVVKLITRSMEGPWGTGAKQTVDLVFNQKVWAIVGSHDGRNAHLAEQVIAKTQVVYISAWSGDPTLAQAYVPWYFSVVPNNIQQGKALVDDIYFQKKFKKVVALADEEYDSENLLKYFVEEVQKGNEIMLEIVRYKTSDFNLKKLVNKIDQQQSEAVVLLGRSHESREILKLLQTARLNTVVYCAVCAQGEDPQQIFNPADFENTMLVDAGFWSSEKGRRFILNYKNEYDTLPSATAAYAYDALCLIFSVIRESDYNREIFKEEIRNTIFEGLTGTIQFDRLGNRTRSPVLVKFPQIH